MAKLKNFTLDGKALRMVAYEDHHGIRHYDVEILPEFNRRGLTGKELLGFAVGLKADVEAWDGLFNICAGEFSNKILNEFFKEVKDDQQEDGT